MTQRDNAVAEPSGSAAERDGGEQDSGQSAGLARDGSAAADPRGSGGESVTGESVTGDAATAGVQAGAEAETTPAEEPADESAGPEDVDGDRGPELAGADEAPVGRDDEAGPPNVADLEQEGEIAADYVEGLLDVADLDGDIDMDVEGDRALVSVVGATLDELVGPRGEVLEALQELTRLAVHRQTGVRTRIMLDVGGYRLRRRAELAETGREAAEEVRRTGQPKTLWAMNRFERKIVHDAVAAAGLLSESEGEEPDRKVVVLPAE